MSTIPGGRLPFEPHTLDDDIRAAATAYVRRRCDDADDILAALGLS